MQGQWDGMYWGRHQKDVDTTQKQTSQTILYPTKTPQFFRHCLWKVNLQANHKQSNNFIQEIPWHHLTFDIFSTSKNWTNQIPGCFSHGVIVPTELLVSEALQTSFLSDPGAVLAMFHQSGGCWSTIDRNVSSICFWWLEMWPLVHVQTTCW